MTIVLDQEKLVTFGLCTCAVGKFLRIFGLWWVGVCEIAYYASQGRIKGVIVDAPSSIRPFDNPKGRLLVSI